MSVAEPRSPRRTLVEMPIVTVYVTSCNYGKYLRQALDSVFAQSLEAWELLIFDDGSVDETGEIAQEYVARAPKRVRLYRHETPRGLRVCANQALRDARGRYLIRLDADDYLDENALLVLSTHLDQDRDLALVYPNWTYVDEEGRILGVERRKKLGRDTQASDLPPHGACTMVRARQLKAAGGYDESFDSQDGHELWLKLLHRFKVDNVETPLFFYRQHDKSMSQDEGRLLSSRRDIKRRAAERWQGPVVPTFAAIVPVKNTYEDMRNIALEPLGEKPLIDYTLDEVFASGVFDYVLVTTDDEHVVEHCRKFKGVLTELRPPELSDIKAKLSEVLADAANTLEREHGVHPDVLVLLSVHAPLRRAEHIREACDTLMVYDVDHVISTYEDYDLHFRHGRDGMEPLNPGMLNTLRFEREALYVDNGAIHAQWREFASPHERLQGRVGHIVMARSESYQIKSLEDRSLVAEMIRLRSQLSAE